MLSKLGSIEKEGMLKITDCELSSMTGLPGDRVFTYIVYLTAETAAAVSADSLNLVLITTPGPPPERRSKPNFSPKTFKKETRYAESAIRESTKVWESSIISETHTELTTDIPNSSVSSFQAETLSVLAKPASSSTATTGLEAFSISRDSTNIPVDSNSALSTIPFEKRHSSSATATQTIVKESYDQLYGDREVKASQKSVAVDYAAAMSSKRAEVAGLSVAAAQKAGSDARVKPSGKELQSTFTSAMEKGYDPAKLPEIRIDTMEEAMSSTFQKEIFTPPVEEEKPQRVVIETMVVEVEKTVAIYESKMASASSFYISAKLQNSSGVTKAQSIYPVNHSKHVNALLVPILAPSLQASIIKQGVVSIGIQQNDTNGASIRLQRRLGPSTTCENDAGTKWETILETALDANDGEMRYIDNVASSLTIMYRVLSVGSNGVVSESFSSKILTPSQSVKTTRGTELNSFAKSNELSTKIYVYASHFPADTVGVSMRKYEIGTRDTLDAKRGISRGFKYVGSTPDAQSIIIKNKQKTAKFIDSEVKAGSVYLYVPIAWTKKGREVVGSSTEVEIPQDAGDDARVSATVSNLVINTTDSSGAALSNKTVSFSTTAVLTDFGFEQVSDAIGDSASAGLFGGDVAANRSAFNDLVQFSIVRENCTTGERESFGVATAGSFTDNRTTRAANNVSDLEPGTRYIYRLTSCIRSPETLFPNLVTKDIDNATLTKYTQQVAKFRGPLQLRKSTLSSTARQSDPEIASGIENTNPIMAGRTRNEISIEAEIPKLNTQVTNFKTKQTRSENYLSWQIQGTPEEIDHFMIFLTTRGGRRLLATVHADPSSPNFSYTHKLKGVPTTSFYYTLVPVDLNFNKLARMNSNVIREAKLTSYVSQTQMNGALVRT